MLKRILSVNNLVICDSQKNVLTNGVSFDIQQNEIVCLQGPSGIGKSVTALAIMNLLPPSLEIKEGEIWFDDMLLNSPNSRHANQKKRSCISMIFQDPKVAFDPLRTVGENLSFILEIQNPSSTKKQRKETVLNALSDIGLNDAKRIYKSYSYELSGGQLQRCLIAGALISDVKLLIADEPTSSLDNQSSKEIMELLKLIHKIKNIPILLITHDSLIADNYANKIINISNTDFEKLYIKNDFETRNKQNEIKTSSENDLLLKVRNLTKYYTIPSGNLFNRKKERIPALLNFNLDLHSGEIIGIVGPSGCGKTTFAKCLCGLLPWDNGTIEIDGKQIKSEVRPQRSAELGIQMIWQHPFSSLNPTMTVREILCENIKSKSKYSKEKEIDLIKMKLDEVELPVNIIEKKTNELSGGECQRVAIANILLLKPKIIIADEAISFLDYKNKVVVLNIFNKLKNDSYISILFMSHDLEMINSISNHILHFTNNISPNFD